MSKVKEIDTQLNHYLELQGSNKQMVLDILNKNPEIEQTQLFTDIYLESRALSVIPNFKCIIYKQDVMNIKSYALQQFIEYGKSYDTIYSELIDLALDKYNEILRRLEIQDSEVNDYELLLTMNIDKQRSEIEFNKRMERINNISDSNKLRLLDK